ncbi:hypothetical protein MKZ38_000349 [Zalerion maritima]|uniref:Uncharacterized protein n=1 Tax=Zalerion maritima TaxID=339359 RepID=A0AAD5RRL2_9PEZI|nr:hypothetical protein MKZ38_000349 [Zalerion maritima]
MARSTFAGPRKLHPGCACAVGVATRQHNQREDKDGPERIWENKLPFNVIRKGMERGRLSTRLVVVGGLAIMAFMQNFARAMGRSNNTARKHGPSIAEVEFPLLVAQSVVPWWNDDLEAEWWTWTLQSLDGGTDEAEVRLRPQDVDG